MTMPAWEQDFRLLFGGLWKGLLDLLGWAETLPSADVLSWALLLTLAFLIVSEQIGVERCLRWGAVVLYTAFIYSTLTFVPDIWKTLYGYTNGKINLIGGTVVAGVGLWLLLHLLFRRFTGCRPAKKLNG